MTRVGLQFTAVIPTFPQDARRAGRKRSSHCPRLVKFLKCNRPLHHCCSNQTPRFPIALTQDSVIFNGQAPTCAVHVCSRREKTARNTGKYLSISSPGQRRNTHQREDTCPNPASVLGSTFSSPAHPAITVAASQ